MRPRLSPEDQDLGSSATLYCYREQSGGGGSTEVLPSADVPEGEKPLKAKAKARKVGQLNLREEDVVMKTVNELSAAIDEKGENFAKGILCALSENDGTWTDVGRDATRVHCGWAHVMSTIPEEAAQLQGRRRSATRKYGSNQIRLPGKEEGFCVPYALQGMETNEAPLARAAVSVVCHHADRRLRVRGIHEAYCSNGVGQ